MQVEDEQDKAKHKTLRDTLTKRSDGGREVVDAFKLLAVSNVEVELEAGEKNGAIDNVQSCSRVEKS